MPVIKYMDAAEVAKYARKILKAEFPDVKFRVRTSKYAGGASIDVYWVDGPTRQAVEALIGPLAGADFDGMQDLKIHRTAMIIPGEDAPVHSMADFIFCNRYFSPAVVRRMCEEIARNWVDDDHQPIPLCEVRESYDSFTKMTHGYAVAPRPEPRVGGMWLTQFIHCKLHELSL